MTTSTPSYDATRPRAERKQHGIFYTPAPVVRYLLRATAPQGAVADLACGDGAFLLEAAAAGCAVMGIDRDAAALARAAAALAAYAPHVSLQCGDGLAPALPAAPDVVLGNPPYLEAKKTDPALKAQCRARFPKITRGGFDIFVCFLQAGLDALPPGGRLGYIVPNKFLVAEYARPLRAHLLATTTIEEIIDVSDLPTFRDAAVYPVMLILRKSPPPPGHCVHTGQVTSLEQLDRGDFPRSAIPQARWDASARRIFWLPPADPVAAGLLTRVLGDGANVPLAQWLDIRWTVSFHRAGMRDHYIFPEPQGAYPRKLLGGTRFQGNGDVRRYRTQWSGWWIDYDEARAKAEKNQFPFISLFDEPKLVIAQNARRIIATLDEDGHVCKDTFLAGRGRGEAPLEYVLALLNSALLSWLYGILYKATHVSGAYLHYLGSYLDELPLRRAADPAPFCTLVRRMLDPACTDDDRRQLDRALDALVFDLYGLSASERALVEAAIPYAWGDQVGRQARR